MRCQPFALLAILIGIAGLGCFRPVCADEEETFSSHDGVHVTEVTSPNWQGVYKLDIQFAVGDIKIVPGYGRLILRKTARDQAGLNEMKLLLTRNGETLKVRTVPMTRRSGSYDLTIYLPQRQTLSQSLLRSDVGDISMQNVSVPSAIVMTEAGDVTVNHARINDLSVTVANGDVALKDLIQPLAANVSVANGQFAAQNVAFAWGANTVRVDNGRVSLAQIGTVHLVADVDVGSAHLSGSHTIANETMTGGHWECGDASAPLLTVRVGNGEVTLKTEGI